jgi:hypothetical protein
MKLPGKHLWPRSELSLAIGTSGDHYRLFNARMKSLFGTGWKGILGAIPLFEREDSILAAHTRVTRYSYHNFTGQRQGSFLKVPLPQGVSGR